MDIAFASPGIFTTNQTGTGQAAAINVSDTGTAAYNGNVSPVQPATCGSSIEIFRTGFGVGNAPDTGGLSHLAAPVTATIGGVPASVEFAGLAPSSTQGL